MKRLGHDLWSFDASDYFQMWCGNWTAPPSVFELIIEMRYSPDEPPSASVTVK